MQTIEERIRQRRLQILVHSCIYYHFNESIISDDKWSRWARELVQLQQDYPDISAKVIWHDVFSDFDGSTGMDLPITDTWVMNKAQQLLSLTRTAQPIKSVTPSRPKKSKPKRSRLF